MNKWTVETLWKKGKLYLVRAFAESRDSPHFPFFAALGPEFLARAVLANRHPALLADPQGGDSILYAFGLPTTTKPKSLPLAIVFARMKLLIAEFSDQDTAFCNFFIDLRNRELHTGHMAFEGIPTGRWLPRYYAVVAKLTNHLGHQLSDLLGNAEASAAEEIIAVMATDKINEVKNRISALQKAFYARSDFEKTMGRIHDAVQFLYIADETGGSTFRKECPCCGGGGALRATKIGETPDRLEDGEVKYQEIYYPTKFECNICGLALTGYDELRVEELVDQLVIDRTRDPIEYFGIVY
jgi:hypothetical protein